MLEKAKKTDLINIHLVEYTTGIDTIRRLVKNGLLNEIQDKSDKRVKLLVLTEKGEIELKALAKRIDEEYSMFLSAISDNKWKKVLPILEEIDEFHNTIYQEHNDKPFAEISNLIDSLKHFYK